ncbi:uncharacterized protein MKZ38_009164 [Zalerion maritima]|uniref:Uncharacterized protein n=1 Tax=Zalerion maritima TaxID=339359 RepID=A0AAD5WM64_9PEZI|nr:uncharacterized protein MKZ38_009164 [Zalerion maritima]
MPWTPEPEPYDPEIYAAWGRKHFGDNWVRDPVYLERQKVLRVLEYKIEGRPFEPDGTDDEGWKRLWARLSKDLPSVKQGSNPASPMPPNNSDSDLSGYNT